MACDGDGIPLHLVAARANDHDSPLLEPTLTGIVEMIGPLPQHRGVHGEDLFPTMHLDRGYDSGKTRDLLDILGFDGEIATKGLDPTPDQPSPDPLPLAGQAHHAPTPLTINCRSLLSQACRPWAWRGSEPHDPKHTDHRGLKVHHRTWPGGAGSPARGRHGGRGRQRDLVGRQRRHLRIADDDPQRAPAGHLPLRHRVQPAHDQCAAAIGLHDLDLQPVAGR